MDDLGKKKNFSKISDILGKFQIEEDKYISQEFQQYGYDLAKELGDLKRKSYYIKVSRDENRGLVETARNFIKDANNVKNPGALFVWKLTQLKKEAKNKKN